MTREQRLEQLEKLCQAKYDIIDQCFKSIEHAQFELKTLEAQYLKLKALLDGKPRKENIRRTNKLAKLRRSMIDIGLDPKAVDELLNAQARK